MDPFALRNHLDQAHRVDWADDLDADMANRLHHDLHDRKPDHGHGHAWAGIVADPQPPMGERAP